MSFTLVIAEHREKYFEEWLGAFRELDFVSVLQIRPSLLQEQDGIDAEIMRGMFAHERYGGTAKPGVSQILSTNGEKGMPPWVVTTAPFPGRVVTERQTDGSRRARVVPEEIREPAEEEYISFSKIFEAVKSFNTERPDSAINTLAFSAEFLNIPRKDISAEIAAIKKAVVDHLI